MCNTWVGALVGAVPPLIGWASAAGQLEPGAGVLATALFCWQMPHFMALAWMCKEDYIRGGFRWGLGALQGHWGLGALQATGVLDTGGWGPYRGTGYWGLGALYGYMAGSGRDWAPYRGGMVGAPSGVSGGEAWWAFLWVCPGVFSLSSHHLTISRPPERRGDEACPSLPPHPPTHL